VSRAWAGAVAAATLAGCASLPPAASGPAIEGREFAARACAGCHAIGPAGESPNGRAPPFRALARQRSDAALRAAIDEISRDGHVEMPPIYVTPAEREALVAYLRRLRPAAQV
jgi:mono/diheme cytochrome c family protein